MKRVIGFLSILIIVLIGYYLQPVLFPPAPETKKVEHDQRMVRHKALKHQTIETEGYAEYVKQPVGKFEAKFGQPTKIEDSGFFFQTRYYSLDQGVLEVNVEAGNVSVIKVMSQNGELEPFKFGMTNRQLSEQINLSADFSLDYDEEPVVIELSENDMRYRPLIAFKNDTFAILFFNGDSDKLIGAAYLDIENLLRLMPYQINSGNPLANRIQESNLDWNVLNQQKQTRLIESINQYRMLRKLPVFQTNSTAMTASKDMLKTFLTSPKKVLSQERMEEWETDQSAHLSNLSFELAPAELKKLAKTEEIDYLASLFYSPTVDPLFSLFNWISRDRLNELYDDPNANSLGVAINQESVLVLIQEPEKTKDSE
ncbi:MAG: CAP-associated domain-containing protein [Enterococcus viikkiensis]